ncbi:MAG: flagellar basal body rod protein FlgB [Nitrospirota bacterium]
MRIFDKTMNLLEQTLDLRAARHKVIATNIANEETPGYRAKELHFLEALSAAVRRKPAGGLTGTNPRHFGGRAEGVPRVAGRVEDLPAPELPLDANSVNLEFEMAKLADNGINYNTSAAILSVRIKQLLDVIRESR